MQANIEKYALELIYLFALKAIVKVATRHKTDLVSNNANTFKLLNIWVHCRSGKEEEWAFFHTRMHTDEPSNNDALNSNYIAPRFKVPVYIIFSVNFFSGSGIKTNTFGE